MMEWSLDSFIGEGIQKCILIGNEALVQIDFLVWRMQFCDNLFFLF